MSLFHILNMSKKEKKKAQLKKNKFHEQMFQIMRLRRAEDSRIQSLTELRKPKRQEKKADGEWSDKTASIRNRLTGKKRESKERWNRFAGTEGGGGRGL
jgi:hypothetical protein